MEALFATQPGAPLVLVGQPNVDEKKIDNPLIIPNALSFLTYRAWTAEVKGLNDFPQEQWPTSIALLYYSYHIMVGLGTVFIAIMAVAAFLLWRGQVVERRWVFSAPLPCPAFPFLLHTTGRVNSRMWPQPRGVE